MNEALRADSEKIIRSSIAAVLPDAAVKRALADFEPGEGRVILIAVGKAAWHMADAAVNVLGRVNSGLVITKYGHVEGDIPGVECVEAGHPVPDENSFRAAEKALALTQDLNC